MASFGVFDDSNKMRDTAIGHRDVHYVSLHQSPMLSLIQQALSICVLETCTERVPSRPSVMECWGLCRSLIAPPSSFSSSPCFPPALSFPPPPRHLFFPTSFLYTHPTVMCICSVQTKRQLNLSEEPWHLFSGSEGSSLRKKEKHLPFQCSNFLPHIVGMSRSKFYINRYSFHMYNLMVRGTCSQNDQYVLPYKIKARFSSSSLTGLGSSFKHIVLSGTFSASYQHLFKDKDEIQQMLFKKSRCKLLVSLVLWS